MSAISQHSDAEFFHDLKRRRKTDAGQVAEACAFLDSQPQHAATNHRLCNERVAGVRTLDEATALIARIVKAGRGTRQQGVRARGKKPSVVLVENPDGY